MNNNTPTQAPHKTPSALKKFLRRLLFFGLAGVAHHIGFFIALYATVFAGLRSYSFLCPNLGPVCSIKEVAYVIFIPLAIGGMIFSAPILRYAAKLTLWNCFAISLLTACAGYVFSSSIITVFQSDSWPYLYLAIPVTIVVFIIHAFLFTLVNKRIWLSALVTAALAIFYIGSVGLLQGWLQDLHTDREYNKELQEAKTLPFKTFAPAYIPKTYRITDSNATRAYYNIFSAYDLTYDQQEQVNHTAESKSLFLNQEANTLNNNAPPCDTPQNFYIEEPRLGDCKHAGRTTNCDVYTQFPSNDGPERAESSCIINGTLISLSYGHSDVSSDEVLKIFESMKPANVEALQREARRNGGFRFREHSY